jgi:glycosyltransferase involved in cell wall biosynthesis
MSPGNQGERPRVALFSELPTPYRWPVFERLLERDDLDLRVFFCAETESDRSWKFDFRPDHRVRFLPVRTFTFTGRRTVHYHLNPTALRELHGGGFDAVFLPGYAMSASQLGAIYCRLTGTPYVMFSETTHLDRRPGPLRLLKQLLVRPLISGADAWLATGVLSRRYLVSYGAQEDSVFFFPNTPDTAALSAEAMRRRPERDLLRAKLGAGAGPVVLFVARLIGVKRCDLLLKAARVLAVRGVGTQLWIAGDGPERDLLERTAHENGLPNVRFLGNVDSAELPGVYAAADVFVLPSDHEPWGAVVCEAAACALPLVLSDRVGAAPDTVTDGENGYCFAAGDPMALAEALERLLEDPEQRLRMGARSMERAKGFAHEHLVRQFLLALDRALESGGKTCRPADT